MRRILITGVSGSGKTTVARALLHRGFDAIDTDADATLSQWVDTAGNTVCPPPVIDDDWLPRHRWVWSADRVTALLSDHHADLVFWCGAANNQQEFWPQFNTVILLQVSEDVMARRLHSASRDNTFGQHEKLLPMLAAFRHRFDSAAIRSGAVVIGADGCLQAVIDQILLVATQHDASTSAQLRRELKLGHVV